MTDLEISKALALAIGWTNPWEARQGVLVYVGGANKVKVGNLWAKGVRVFDYRDWNVNGPIAARYDCFPFQLSVGIWCTDNFGYHYEATPQKAIAMAVIGAAKK